MARSIDQCSLCGAMLHHVSSEQWRTVTGEVIALPRANLAYVFVETSRGEICICEECFRAKRFEGLTSDDFAAIGLQFGLEYREANRFADSVDAIHWGLKFKQTADMLASIALAYGELGEPILEREFYSQAVRLDPNHLISRENLKRINREV